MSYVEPDMGVSQPKGVRPILRRVSIPAVLVGGVVDIVATNIAMLPFMIHVLASRNALELPEAEQVATLARAFEEPSGLYATALLVGCACSVIGGWVAARMAKREYILHGALSGWSCLALGIYFLVSAPNTVSEWEHAAFFILTPALGALGGAIRQRQDARRPLHEAPGETRATISRLSGWGRALYLVNRALLIGCVVLALAFGLMGMYGLSSANGTLALGSLIIAAFSAVLVSLYYFAGRALLSGRRHWLLHLSAVTGCVLLALVFL